MDNNQGNQRTDEEFLTCEEAAKKMRISTQTIRTWILLGKIDSSKCYQAGRYGRWRIHKSAFTKLSHI